MGVVPDGVVLPSFVVVAVLLGAIGDHRSKRRAAAWPPPGRDRFDPAGFTGEQLGYLSGQGSRAIEAAVARLRVGGALTYRWSTNTLVSTGRRLPSGERTALSTAVLSAVSAQTPIGELRKYPKVHAALSELGDDLDHAAKGIDVPPRYFVSAGAPLVGWGVAGVVLGLVPPFHWRTDVSLIALGIFAAFVGVIQGSRPEPMETVRVRTVRRAKERNAHLDPGMNPALSTYGPAAAAVAVGLFGLPAMVATDGPLSSVSVGDQEAEAASATDTDDSDYDDGFVYGCAGFDTGGSTAGGAGCGVSGVH